MSISVVNPTFGCIDGRLPMAEALQLVLEMNEWTWQRCMDLLPRACDFYVKAMVACT
jgi:hypothetical protein